MNENYQGEKMAMMAQSSGMLGGLGAPKVMNPTLRENIEMRIQSYKDEIVRLEKIKEQMPQLLDVNLRDLREAMQF